MNNDPTGITTTVSRILRQLVPRYTADITGSTSLTENLGLYSSRLVEFIIELEDQFSVRIHDDDIAKLSTVGDAITLVHSRASNLVAK